MKVMDSLEGHSLAPVTEIQAIKVGALSDFTGREMRNLLPSSTTAGWRTATEVGKMFSVSANLAGRVAGKLGLKGSDKRGLEGLSVVKTNKRPGQDATCDTYLYSPEAARRIGEELKLRSVKP